MTTKTTTARARAQAAGYFVREGAYQGTSDDRLGRWYIGHVDDEAFRPWGVGFASQAEAWRYAAQRVEAGY